MHSVRWHVQIKAKTAVGYRGSMGTIKQRGQQHDDVLLSLDVSLNKQLLLSGVQGAVSLLVNSSADSLGGSLFIFSDKLLDMFYINIHVIH